MATKRDAAPAVDEMAKYLTIAQAAEVLGVPESRFRARGDKTGLPHLRHVKG